MSEKNVDVIREVFVLNLAPPILAVRSAVKDSVKVELPPPILAVTTRTDDLQAFNNCPREAAAATQMRVDTKRREKQLLIDTKYRTSDETDRHKLRQSAPAVFHLYKTARAFYAALETKSPLVTRQKVLDSLSKFGKPFDTDYVLTQSFTFIDPHHPWGIGDANHVPLDAAKLTNPEFIRKYKCDEFVGDRLALILETTHSFIEFRLALLDKQVDLRKALLEELRSTGISGKQALKALIEIINWKPKGKRKTPSLKKPEPDRQRKT